MDSQFTNSYTLLADMLCLSAMAVVLIFLVWLFATICRFAHRVAQQTMPHKPPYHVASLLIYAGKEIKPQVRKNVRRVGMERMRQMGLA
jgi:Na+-transporting methylmalonyl-CoA/oxaloacetate decarboxylase gamma subunit